MIKKEKRIFFQVEEMIELIMEAFVDMLQSEDWLTEHAKEFAKEKVPSILKFFHSFLIVKKLVIQNTAQNQHKK